MAEYNHRDVEQKWQQFWNEHQTFKTNTTTEKPGAVRPKYYALDMFPYPSGAGLHVGHPLGYIASDIVSRYKRLKGYNVLHPMGFDSFGLPAEQYAIQTGQHPAVTTEVNIARYIEQLKNIGFSYDWSREVRTSDPAYYKWTQWIFMELFRSWYNKDTNRAEPIETLLDKFATNGTTDVNAVCDEDVNSFTAAEWNAYSTEKAYAITLKYRLTYLADAVVNWCPALGTVLANDEVKDGVSERGGYPVEQKLMRQWMMRITAYADRLLTGLDTIDWTESIKEQQRNWIGKSVGASVKFRIDPTPALPVREGDDKTSPLPQRGGDGGGVSIEVFTTRVDTIYGVTFMVLAPEHELVPGLTTPEQREAVAAYIDAAKMRSERDRMADVKDVSGVFTGSYCINPLNNERVPIYLADYVLAGYGTGAVMAVPSGDQRDWNFAKHFNLPIIPVLDAQKDIDQQADNTKEGRYINSGIIDGMTYQQATPALISWLEERGLGRGKINYRMRDAVFSRQRYWGEPVPIYFKAGSDGTVLPYLINEQDLPLELPAIDKYLPTETGEPPLGRAEGWKYNEAYEYELSTMPGWAGSSWYWYRYMDPHNPDRFASKEDVAYWQNVDLYIGGTEHATGHLLYSRFWNKFMFDRGYVPEQEPFKKLINQGMIQGVSQMAWKLVVGSGGIRKEVAKDGSELWVLPVSQGGEMKILAGSSREIYFSNDLIEYITGNPKYASYEFIRVNVSINSVSNNVLNAVKYFYDYPSARASHVFVCRGGLWQSGKFIPSGLISESHEFTTVPEVEKMSKSKFNVVNPDDIIKQYGADVLRLYEMFLGPLEQAKPWNTNGIDGVYRFIRKFWRLFYKDNAAGAPDAGSSTWIVTDEQPTAAELKVLHRTIQKAENDIEHYSFNTSVSAFMVCVNELTALNCHKRAILQDLVLLLQPYAPYITEELWAVLGNEPGTVSKAQWPVFNPNYLVEDAFEYPIQINGKVRTTISFAIDRAATDIEREVLADEVVQKWLEGKAPKKVVVVPKRIVNVVV